MVIGLQPTLDRVQRSVRRVGHWPGQRSPFGRHLFLVCKSPFLIALHDLADQRAQLFDA
jgi:hypothetical protein